MLELHHHACRKVGKWYSRSRSFHMISSHSFVYIADGLKCMNHDYCKYTTKENCWDPEVSLTCSDICGTCNKGKLLCFPLCIRPIVNQDANWVLLKGMRVFRACFHEMGRQSYASQTCMLSVIRDGSLFTGNTGLQKSIPGYGNFQHCT